MVFLKVIPASLLFIHGSAGHCNLETCMCVCARVPNSIGDQEVELHAQEKSREKGEKEGGGRGAGRGCGREYGLGFPSLRAERKSIDSEAESEADRVAAQGCAATQREHDPRHQQGRHLTPHRAREGSGGAEDSGRKRLASS